MQATRREFLSWGALAAATSLLPRLSGAPAPSSAAGPLRLGFSLYGSKTLSLADALTSCAKIGYDNVELCLSPGFPAEPAHFSASERRRVGQLSRDLGIKISSAMNDMKLFGNPSGHAANLESIKAAAGVLRDCGAEPNAPLESVLGGKIADWEGEKERAADRLAEWGATAAAEGVTIAVKGHAGAAVETPVKLRWLIDRAGSPRIRVNFDQSHYDLAGFSLAASLEALKPYICLVHAKDSTGTEAEPHFLLPGDGKTDFGNYFTQLRQVGYSGAVVVEVSAQLFSVPGYDPKATEARCYRYLSGIVAAANA